MHGASGLLAGGDGLHHRGGATDGIPAGKDIGVAGLQGLGIHPHGAPFAEGAGALLGEAGPVRLLADGRDDGIHVDDELRSGNRLGASPAAIIGLAEFHLDALDGGNTPLVGDDPHRVGEGHDLDPFLTALGDLLGAGGHFGFTAAIEDEGLPGAAAQGAAHRIHGHIAATDDRHPVSQGDLRSQVDRLEIFHPGVDATVVFAFDAQDFALGGTDAHEKGFIALLTQLADGHLFSDLDPGFKFDPHLADHLDLFVDDLAGKTIGRNPHAEHAAQHGQLFEHRHRVAL